MMSLGLEFKDVAELKKKLGFHPRWETFRKILTDGFNFELEELDKRLRIMDLQHAYNPRIHKSAEKKGMCLSKEISKEIEFG